MKIEKKDYGKKKILTHEKERVMGCSGHCITRCDVMCAHAFHSGTVRTSSLGRQLLESNHGSNPTTRMVEEAVKADGKTPNQ